MANERILVVDDEDSIRELLEYNLTDVGYVVETASTGEQALEMCEQNVPDLILLDIMLPGIDGLTVCKELRAKSDTARVPIIMLTARREESDKVWGLETGADDYITKPFGVRELVARVMAMLRRMRNDPNEGEDVPSIYEAFDLKIDTEAFEVWKSGERLDLTLKEFELLTMLIAQRGKVLTRDLLLDRVWGYEFYGETRTVDVHIRHIRQKIGDDGKYIETVRGVGYRFASKDEEG